MRPVDVDHPATPPAAALSLFAQLTDSAMRSFGGLLDMQHRLTHQMVSSLALQQQDKTTQLQDWLNQRTNSLHDSLEQGVQASKELYVATTHAQADWLQASERLFHTANLNLLATVRRMTPTDGLPAVAIEPLCKAMHAGSCAVESMAKVTRQVTQFAGTNLGNAAVHAARAAREELAPRHRSGIRHH